MDISPYTLVIGRHRPIEVQIRTTSMHQIAEYGIAARTANIKRVVSC